MVWIFWLYIVPMLFILTFILLAKGMINANIWNILFVMAIIPGLNLFIVLGVIWRLCTIKDFQEYLNDPEAFERMRKFEEELDELMNKNK